MNSAICHNIVRTSFLLSTHNTLVNGRVVVAEIVQQKKRIEILALAETEGALKPDSRAFDG
jgi:hypothetical protein